MWFNVNESKNTVIIIKSKNSVNIDIDTPNIFVFDQWKCIICMVYIDFSFMSCCIIFQAIFLDNFSQVIVNSLDVAYIKWIKGVLVVVVERLFVSFCHI